MVVVGGNGLGRAGVVSTTACGKFTSPPVTHAAGGAAVQPETVACPLSDQASTPPLAQFPTPVLGVDMVPYTTALPLSFRFPLEPMLPPYPSGITTPLLLRFACLES